MCVFILAACFLVFDTLSLEIRASGGGHFEKVLVVVLKEKLQLRKYPAEMPRISDRKSAFSQMGKEALHGKEAENCFENEYN